MDNGSTPGNGSVVPVRGGRRQDRVVGAFVTVADRTRFVPAVDVQRLATIGLGVVAVLTTGAVVAASRRRAPAIKSVTMGHGGWISLRNSPAQRLQTSRQHRAPRPWWARFLGARRLIVER